MLFPEHLWQWSLQHPQSEGVFFEMRFHLKENKRTNSRKVNITVCSCVLGAAVARRVPFAMDTCNVVIDSRPHTRVLHHCAAGGGFAKEHFSDSGRRGLLLQDLNSALDSISDSDCGQILCPNLPKIAVINLLHTEQTETCAEGAIEVQFF